MIPCIEPITSELFFPDQWKITNYLDGHLDIMDICIGERNIIETVAREFADTSKLLVNIRMRVSLILKDFKLSQEVSNVFERNISTALEECALDFQRGNL